MKKTIGISCALLIVGHLLTEAHSIFCALWKELQTLVVDIFWVKPSYDVTFPWWIKGITDDILWCIVFFVGAVCTRHWSQKLYFINVIYFFYHVIDLGLFLYNYKQTTMVYWLLLGATIAATIRAFLPSRNCADYKSLV